MTTTTFLPNQTVQSARTGFLYTVLGREEDTLDGQEVVTVRSHETGAVFPALVSTLAEVQA